MLFFILFEQCSNFRKQRYYSCTVFSLWGVDYNAACRGVYCVSLNAYRKIIKINISPL